MKFMTPRAEFDRKTERRGRGAVAAAVSCTNPMNTQIRPCLLSARERQSADQQGTRTASSGPAVACMVLCRQHTAC
jgi:hypothetical protein